MTNSMRTTLNKFSTYLDSLVAFVVVAVIGMIIVPLPAFLLDILLVMNIALAILILVLTLFTNSVLDFSSFPTLLLLTTMIRLALNVSSTRLILSEGEAGQVIDTFANFVTGNNYIVGAVIFIIIVLIQMLVVTNGSSRVAEVSARFTLDAMPGKQMAIDADLNSGMIDEAQAKQRRSNLENEANFYGAMDGASKFVKGDAIAGIVITIINLVGGILIFSINGSYTVTEALAEFGKLTIGDGLVSQIPSLLISVASGILVTRTANDKGFGDSLGKELFRTPQVLYIVATILFLFAFIPGFPFFPFALIAVLLVTTGYLLTQNEADQQKVSEAKQAQADTIHKKERSDEPITSFQVDPIAIEIGYGLIPLANEEQDANLTSHIQSVRKQLSHEKGIVLTPIRIRDNLQFTPNRYAIKIKGNEVASGELYVDKYMVVEPELIDIDIKGIPTKEPAFGLDALWVDEKDRELAELHDLTVVDPLTVLVTHLKEVIHQHAHDLLGRQEVKQLLEGIKDQYNVVIDELIPDILRLGEVQKVLQNLLKEDIPINDLVTILETLADYGTLTKDPETLTDYVRQSLKRTVVKPHLDERGQLNVLTVHPDTEERITESIQKASGGSIPVLQPRVITSFFDSLNQQHNQLEAQGVPHVLLTSPKIRAATRNLLAFNFPDIAVLSLNEVPNDTQLETRGMIEATL
ncbi:flagellar biosynthesis protein FlhA [Lacticigenium naphthae]|uniref:flagellar biosynthesis protein FlhA n=1 Tax=Lacticigenium naphthae TaxID=515351 RepID=UPI00040CB650|nr:flagellar biosynthesis protein FlhA [Lacticigenium naphthae]